MDTKSVPITLAVIENLKPPPRGNRIVYDSEVPGFGVRITAAGAISFVLTYWIHNRQRRYTIGRFPEFKPPRARNEAVELRQQIREGHDPLRERFLNRTAPLMKDLGEQYLSHAKLTNRPKTIKNKKQMLDGVILTHLGKLPVAGVTADDLRRVHALLEATPYQANRVRSLLSAMFGFAIERGMRADNPITKSSVPKYSEHRREQWLRFEELARLKKALDGYEDQSSANAIRLLLLTGSRKHEVLQAKWEQFDLERGVWTKPSAHTKQKRVEHVPLGSDALRLLRSIKKSGEFLFPGRIKGRPLENIRGPWVDICKAAKLSGFRIHDLRHTYASHLVSSGVPLAHVGKLLGHTQSQTTERYAHLADSPLRKATNRFGKIVEKARLREK